MALVYLSLCFFILFFLLFFGIYPRHNKKRSEKLLDYYQGSFRYPLGDLVIPYENHLFYISRIARGGGINNTPGGSYPLLWAYVEKTPKTFLGHEKSKKYSLGRFFLLPKLQKNLTYQGQNFLLATEDAKIFSKNLNFEEVKKLFEKDFQHLTLSSEIHIQNFLPQKKYLLKYTGLSEEIYKTPESLKDHLNKILNLLIQLEVKFPS